MAREPVDVTIGGRDITLPAEWCETTYRGTKTGGRNWEFYDVTITIDGTSYTGFTGWWDGDARNNVHLDRVTPELKEAIRRRKQ